MIRIMLVQCYPRIHIGLMDMGDATARRYGGAGFTLSGLPIEILATQSKSIKLHGQNKLDEKGQGDLHSCLQRLIKLVPSIKVHLTIKRLPPQHIGLGTKTALLLGTLTAASLAAGVRLSRIQLQELSGRGGASGVGINSFFTGGFLTDAGHDSLQLNKFAPSSFSKPTKIPPVICRIRIPNRWVFYLLLPRGYMVSGGSERDFFERNAPIPKIEVMQSLALLYHGVVPALLTCNLSLLKKSIAGLHRTGFKRRELEAQTANVNELINQFAGDDDCVVGLSSMGPLVYVIANRRNCKIKLKVEQLCKEYKAVLLDSCTGRNRGFEVIS